MTIVLLLMILGGLVGWLIRDKKKLLKINSRLTTWSIYTLLFLLGISVGTNDKIIDNFGQIGFLSVLITLFAVVGSAFVAWLCYIIFFKKQNP
ncbi:MAG: lysine exporter LysO family protein [Bacteroidales bacterium]|nr:lysine exporter LysO family protein [Bacteroidales bacterium]